MYIYIYTHTLHTYIYIYIHKTCSTRAAAPAKPLRRMSAHAPGFQTGSGQAVFACRSATNSHSNAMIVPESCHNYGILRHFCKKKHL